MRVAPRLYMFDHSCLLLSLQGLERLMKHTLHTVNVKLQEKIAQGSKVVNQPGVSINTSNT